MKRSLPRYKDCKYSLFISYAFDDNDNNNQWVRALKDAIGKCTIDLKKKLGKNWHDIYFSEENGKTVGSLNDELKECVKNSFAMLLIVGNNYVSSTYCEKELKLFSEFFGDDGVKEHRLYIAVMTEEALFTAQENETWKKIVTDGKYVPFYTQSTPNTVCKTRLTETIFDDSFFENVKKLISPLKEVILNDYMPFQSFNTHQSHSTVQTSESQKTNNESLTIAISDTMTSELQKEVEAMQEKFKSHGVRFITIEKGWYLEYEKEDPKNKIRENLAKADVLIVPFQADQLITRNHPGGHLSILETEWKVYLKRNQDNIFWYNPFGDMSSIAKDNRHYEIISNLKPIYQSSDEISSQLMSNVEKSNEIVIHIEEDREIKVYELLSEKIEKVWERVIRNNPTLQAPKIRIESLDLSNLDNKQNEAHGYVLVSHISLKPLDSLKSQITNVQKAFPTKGIRYPGRIALVFPQNIEPNHHKTEWRTIKCRIVGENQVVPYDIDLSPDGEPDLEEFLKKLLRKYNEVNQLSA